jgi:CheY-like chemotaxis protein
VVCQILTHFGHQVHAVESGFAAMQAIAEQVYDVVIMDCRMVEMDGLETTRRLRAGQAGPQGLTVPVVALTAQAFAIDRQACLDAGMNDFLSKPVDIDDLLGAVTRWGRQVRACSLPQMARAPEFDAIAGDEVFDSTVLAALPMVLDGSQPDYGEVVLSLYMDSLPAALDRIRQAAHSGQADTLQRLAHSLKSSSAAVGAMAMAALAAEIEASLQTGVTQMSSMPGRFDIEAQRLQTRLGRSVTQECA